MELAQSLQAANGVTGPSLKDLYVQESYQMNVLMGYLYNQQELFEKIITHLNKISSSLEEYRAESKDERLYLRRSEKAREKWLSEIEGSIKRFEGKISEILHSHRSQSLVAEGSSSFSNRNDAFRSLSGGRRTNAENSYPQPGLRTRRIESSPFSSVPAHTIPGTEGLFYDLIE